MSGQHRADRDTTWQRRIAVGPTLARFFVLAGICVSITLNTELVKAQIGPTNFSFHYASAQIKLPENYLNISGKAVVLLLKRLATKRCSE